MWCILVQWVTPINHVVGHLEIFWSRVPIFFIGINMGEMVRRKQTVDGQGIWMVFLMFVMALASSIFLEQEKHGQFPLFIERMLYIPLTVTAILILNRVFRRLPAKVNYPGMLPHPSAFCAGLPPQVAVLLADLPALSGHHPAPGMGTAKGDTRDTERGGETISMKTTTEK